MLCLRPTSHKIVLNVCNYSDKKVYPYMNTVGVTAANDELAGGRSGRQRMSAPGSRAGGVEAGLAKMGLEDLDLALLGDRTVRIAPARRRGSRAASPASSLDGPRAHNQASETLVEPDLTHAQTPTRPAERVQRDVEGHTTWPRRSIPGAVRVLTISPLPSTHRPSSSSHHPRLVTGQPPQSQHVRKLRVVPHRIPSPQTRTISSVAPGVTRPWLDVQPTRYIATECQPCFPLASLPPAPHAHL
ncbi:hypothetical protein AcV7_003273 [Taiwanofungus camphoratus]|nr:hypothetical protein AcV7_003273 [Antrodia cinnamomea]